MKKPKLLILATGGTLSAAHGEHGLTPAYSIDQLISNLNARDDHYEMTSRDILRLDSSNIQPENWQFIARTVFEAHEDYDGIVITHGTDTMAYTAAMLSYMLQCPTIPIVLTGSQLPMNHPLSDAPANLNLAMAMAASGCPGVFLAFNRRVILGTRAVKTHTTDFAAFESINAPLMAQLSGDGLQIFKDHLPPRQSNLRMCLNDRMCSDVFLLKLIPGLNPEIFERLIQMNYKGLVIEAFGIGGLHCLRRDHVSALEKIIQSGIPIVITSQCLYERSDFSRYETGRLLKEKGAIEAFDMTTEAAVTKLMWLLGQSSDYGYIVREFGKAYYGEISL